MSGLACPNVSKHLTMLELLVSSDVSRCQSDHWASAAEVAESDPHRLLPRSGWTSQRVK